MFIGQIACQSVEVAGGHPHAQSMTGSDERGFNGIFIPLFQVVTG
jgi:hypothetical protein